MPAKQLDTVYRCVEQGSWCKTADDEGTVLCGTHKTWNGGDKPRFRMVSAIRLKTERAHWRGCSLLGGAIVDIANYTTMYFVVALFPVAAGVISAVVIKKGLGARTLS